jgi:hypothetical protein
MEVISPVIPVMETPAIQNPPIEMPKHRTEVSNWLLSREAKQKGAIVWQSMGVGKTLTAFTFLKNFPFDKYRPVIATPKNLIFSWKNENKKFGLGLDKIEYVSHKDLFYDTNRSMCTRPGDSRRPVLIIDECHFLVYFIEFGIATTKAKAETMITLRDKPIKILLLSGTPIPMEISDIRILIFLCCPARDMTLSKKQFKIKYFESSTREIVQYGWIAPLNGQQFKIIAFNMALATVFATTLGFSVIKYFRVSDEDQRNKILYLVWLLYMCSVTAATIGVEADNSIPVHLNRVLFLKDMQKYISYYNPRFLESITTPKNMIKNQKMAKDGLLRYFPALTVHSVPVQLTLDQMILYMRFATDNLRSSDFRSLGMKNDVIRMLKSKTSTDENMLTEFQRVGFTKTADQQPCATYKRAIDLAKNFRSVIWTQFDYTAKEIVRLIGDKAVRLLDVEDHKRSETLNSFSQSHPGDMILVLDSAFNQGISVGEAQRMILLDQPRDMATFSQVVARVRRFHSHNSVNADMRMVHLYELYSTSSSIMSFLRSKYTVFSQGNKHYAPWAQTNSLSYSLLGPGETIRNKRMKTMKMFYKINFEKYDIGTMADQADTCCIWSPKEVELQCPVRVACLTTLENKELKPEEVRR